MHFTNQMENFQVYINMITKFICHENMLLIKNAWTQLVKFSSGQESVNEPIGMGPELFLRMR